MFIDINLDLGEDANGRDPDLFSSTLKKYHKLLWTKPLPNGEIFSLTESLTGKYLTYESTDQVIELGSDSIANSYAHSKSTEISHILSEVEPELIESFRKLNNTIGAFIVFPSSRIDGQMTINGARGFNTRIADRFDLTLECIRRHYAKEASPLTEVISRYKKFFDLFLSFQNYIDFFHLNGLVRSDGSIKFFVGNREPFKCKGYPQNRGEYLEYRENSMLWVAERNRVIASLEIA